MVGKRVFAKICLLIIFFMPFIAGVPFACLRGYQEMKWNFLASMLDGYSYFVAALLFYLLIVYLAGKIIKLFR